MKNWKMKIKFVRTFQMGRYVVYTLPCITFCGWKEQEHALIVGWLIFQVEIMLVRREKNPPVPRVA